VARALLPPFLLLALFLWGLLAVQANRHLAGALLEEARALAAHFSGRSGTEALGVRRTLRPQDPLPLLGEPAAHVEVKGTALRARAAEPMPEGALEAVRTYPLFLPPLWPALLLALGAASWAWARVQGGLRRTLGLGPEEARARLALLEAALEALEEGVLVLEGPGGGRVVYWNPRALALLGLPQGALPPLPLDRVWPALQGLASQEGFLALPTRRPARVRLLQTGPYRVVVVQDQAELFRLAESLTQSRRHLELLRAQAHEFQNLLHAVGGLLEMGRKEEALKLVQGELAAEAEMEALLARVELPLVAALLLGKLRRAKELGVALTVEGRLPARYAPLSEALTAVAGHLLENALEAAGAGGRVRVHFREAPGGLGLEVWDTGPGVPKGLARSLFAPGVSGRGEGRGYGLALAKAQVEARGGRLGYHREGEWTVFHAFLPEGGWSGR
jgi:sensor histidine kinase regulating citrate/malate metabolism